MPRLSLQVALRRLLCALRPLVNGKFIVAQPCGHSQAALCRVLPWIVARQPSGRHRLLHNLHTITIIHHVVPVHTYPTFAIRVSFNHVPNIDSADLLIRGGIQQINSFRGEIATNQLFHRGGKSWRSTHCVSANSARAVNVTNGLPFI